MSFYHLILIDRNLKFKVISFKKFFVKVYRSLQLRNVTWFDDIISQKFSGHYGFYQNICPLKPLLCHYLVRRAVETFIILLFVAKCSTSDLRNFQIG